MFKLFRYLKSVWVEVIITIIFLMLQVWLQLQLPNTMADVSKYINIMTINPSTSEAYKEALKDIWIMGGKMLAYALGVTITAIIVGYTSSRISTIFGQKLRNDIFKKVTSFSINDYDKFGTSSLITRSSTNSNGYFYGIKNNYLCSINSYFSNYIRFPTRYELNDCLTC